MIILNFFFHFRSLYGYKYFSLIDYGNNSTYKIGIPDVSGSDDGMDRQKCVTIDESTSKPDYVMDLKKYIFNRLASRTQIDNYLINNIKQILIKSFTDFFHDEFGRVQDQAERNPSPTEQKHPFFVTHNVDPKQSQHHKNVVAEKLHILKDIIDINIKEVFFKPYTDKDIIALINMETKTMDLVRAINEYVRADASLYLEWRDPVLYNRFYSQMLSEYKQEEPNKKNIESVRQIISNEFKDFAENWYDNESLILSSKKRFGFRSRQLIDKIGNSLRVSLSFILNNILKLCWEKLRRCYNKTRSYISKNTWIQIVIGYTLLSIFSGFCQAIFQKWIVNDP